MKVVILYICSSHQFLPSGLYPDLNFLRGIRRVVDFQFIYFLAEWMGVTTSKLLMQWSRNRKFCRLLFNEICSLSPLPLFFTALFLCSCLLVQLFYCDITQQPRTLCEQQPSFRGSYVFHILSLSPSHSNEGKHISRLSL